MYFCVTSVNTKDNGAQRIQPARGWCATVGGNTVQIVSTYPASPEARPPSFLEKPAVRPRSMAGGAPTPCGIRSTMEELNIYCSQHNLTSSQYKNRSSTQHPGHPKYQTTLPSAQTENTSKEADSSPTFSPTQHSRTSRRHKPSTRTTQKRNF